MTNASKLPSCSRDNAVASASKMAHRSGASTTPSSETRVDSISLRIVVLFLEWLVSADGDLAHVDCDQQRLRDELVVALPGVAPSRGGDDDAIDVAVIGGVEQPGGPAEDVNGEVMAAQQAVRAEARDLLAGVAFYVIGKRHFQPPPRFTAGLDRGDLFGDESGPGVEERRIQVRPHRLPGEIGEMDVVPGGLELMAVKRLLRVVACVDERAVAALQDDSAGLEDRPSVLTGEVHCQPLPRGVRLEANVLQRVSLVLEGPEGPGNSCVGGDRLELIPSVQAAVRGD